MSNVNDSAIIILGASGDLARRKLIPALDLNSNAARAKSVQQLYPRPVVDQSAHKRIRASHI